MVTFPLDWEDDWDRIIFIYFIIFLFVQCLQNERKYIKKCLRWREIQDFNRLSLNFGRDIHWFITLFVSFILINGSLVAFDRCTCIDSK